MLRTENISNCSVSNSSADTQSLNLSPFKPSLISYTLGTLIGLTAVPGWVGNLLVLTVLISRKFLRSSSSVVYKLVASLAFSDFLQLSISIFYLAPASCMQSGLLPVNLVVIPGTIFTINWFHMWFMLCFIALNRYVAVCRFAEYKAIFTHTRTTFCVLLSWLVALLLTVVEYAILPCCRLFVSFIVYSLIWEPHPSSQVNWTDRFSLSGNISTTVFMVVCYTLVLRKMKESRRNVEGAHSEEQSAQQRAKEARLSIQFLVIAVVYMLCWTTFRAFPIVVGKKVPEAYAFVALLVTINCSINPYIYLRYNEVIRKELLILIGKRSEVAPVSTNSTRYTA